MRIHRSQKDLYLLNAHISEDGIIRDHENTMKNSVVTLFFYPLIIILFFSCNVEKNVFIGTYERQIGLEVGYKIEIRVDSSFVYYWQNGLNYGETKGKWGFQRKYLILNSEKQPKEDNSGSYIIKENKIISPGKIEIKILDKNKVPIPLVNCVLFTNSGQQNGITNDDGFFECKGSEVSKIKFTCAGYTSFEYVPDSSNYNYFEIILRESDMEHYVFFVNERWNVKHDMLTRVNNLYFTREKFKRVR